MGGDGKAAGDRVGAIDGLRGVAAVSVFLFHARFDTGLRFGPVDAVVSGGGTAVLLFFAISGYLLYRPFLVGDVDLPTYAVRRFLRIWPAYAVAVVVLGGVLQPQLIAGHWLSFATLTQTFDPDLTLRLIGQAWTLTAEACFYIALPVLAAVLARAGPTRRTRAVLLLGVLSLGLNVALVVWALATGAAIALQLPNLMPFCLWMFVPGMLVATLEAEGRLRIGFLGAGVGVLLLVVGAILHLHVFNVFTAAGSFLVLAAAVKVRLSGPALTLASTLGALSYGIYLWHWDLFRAFRESDLSPYAVLGIVALLTLAAATSSYLLVERPAIRFGRALPGWTRQAAERGRARRALKPVAP